MKFLSGVNAGIATINLISGFSRDDQILILIGIFNLVVAFVAYPKD